MAGLCVPTVLLGVHVSMLGGQVFPSPCAVPLVCTVQHGEVTWPHSKQQVGGEMGLGRTWPRDPAQLIFTSHEHFCQMAMRKLGNGISE